MGSEFEMSMMGELLLRTLVHQKKEGISIHQQKYIKELLMKFGIQDAKISDTLMAAITKLKADKSGTSVDETKYGGMIPSLLYLTASIPDIVFSVGM